jgi:hypothetical protein
MATRQSSSYSYHHKIMKLIILRLNTVNKPSPMPEDVTKIRINNQPCKGINLTTRHVGPEGTTSANNSRRDQKSRAGSYLALVPSSLRMPRLTHVGGPNTIPLYIREVRQGIVQLLDTRSYSVWGFHMSRMC